MCQKEERKNGKIKSDKPTEEFGSIFSATFAENLIAKNNLTSTESNVTSAMVNAMLVTAKRLCPLMSNLLGKGVSLALLKLAEDVNVIKSGNEQYSRVMGFDVYGVEGMKGWKLTTSKNGAPTQNFVTSFPTDVHSV